MSRLLLVDDNPSIHRIAESLLAPTDIELVCVDSAAEALDRFGRGERFDVALVDTAMPGMDGWTLLQRLRDMEETALMPIALMAGVLDLVDPAKLAKAPIQGFLKKPIELRELGDRVKALLATPVIPPPSPFSTMPATAARDLLSRAEIALPELRPEAAPEARVELPVEEDLLILTAEDLWPEEAAVVTVPEVPEEVATYPTSVTAAHLELEELDLDSLQDLTGVFLSGSVAEPEIEPEPEIEIEPEIETEPEPEIEPELELEPTPELPLELEPELNLAPELAPLPEPAQDVLEDSFAAFPDLDVLDSLPADWSLPEGPDTSLAADLADAGMPALPEPEPVPVAPALPDAAGQTPAAPGPVPGVSPEQAQVLLQALLADPALMDALAKAVVARLGDEVLRELAWEIMPELAGRLQSQAHDPS